MKNPQKKRKEKSKGIDLTRFLEGSILYDSVLIEPIMIENDGLVLKPQQYEDKPEFGKVLACGEGRIFDNGTVVPLKIAVGQLVFFQKYSAQKLRISGKDLLIIREEDIYWHE